MNSTVKTTFNFITRFGISGLLLWWLSTIVDIEKTKEVIQSADRHYLLYGFLFFIGINILLVVRWKVFMRALQLQAPLHQVIRFYLVGLFGNLFLPSAIGGDIIKIAGMCKYCPTDKAKVVGSVFIDRVSGYCGIIIVSLLAFIFGFKLINDPGLIGPILFLVPGFFTMMFLLFSTKFNAWIQRITSKWPKLQHSLGKFHKDMSLMKGNHRYGLLAVFLACVGQVLFAVCFFLIAKALHQEVQFVYFLIFVPLICVASSVPSIGGLGTREAGAAYLFSRIGVDSGVAVSISLMTFIYMVVIGLFGGLYYVLTLSSGRVQHSAPDS